MISAKFLWGNVFFGGKLQIDAKKFKFWNFWEHPLYEISEYAFKWGFENCFEPFRYLTAKWEALSTIN